jgi:AbrB family looped-hinge helix DNA binding protein
MTDVSRVDEKGRVSIPAGLRARLGLTAGTVVFMREESGSLVLRQAPNPFDTLAEHAVQEHRAGRTIGLDDIDAYTDALNGQ